MLQAKLKILLIEGDEIEVIKIKRAISKNNYDYSLTLATNGDEAITFLEENFPNIILLDLDTPKTNGIEFISILKKNNDLKHIPIIILTNSEINKSISELYKLGIAGYILKPLEFDEYSSKINTTIKYWSLNEFIKL